MEQTASVNNQNNGFQTITRKHAIMILVVSTLIMIAAGFSNFKFIPILLNFMEAYHLEMGAMGVVMSVFQWVCIIAMLPAGFVISRMSPRYSGVLAIAFITLGNIVGLFAGNVGLLVLGRVIEALGFCLIQILTQSVVSSVFRGSKMLGTATGILNTGMMFGQIIHFSLAPTVANKAGLNGVYYYIIITIIILAIIWFFAINKNIVTVIKQTVAEREQNKPVLSKSEKLAKKMAVFKTPQIWLIAVGFTLIGGAVARVGQYIPTYMTTELGIDQVVAGNLNSLATAFGIVAFIVYGILADRLNTRRKLMIFSCLSVIAVYLCLMYLPAGLLIIFIILYGTLPRAFTTLTYSCYPDLFEDNDQIPIAHSTVMFVGNLIGAALTAIFGYVIQFAGYTALWYLCIVLGVAAAVCWFFAKKIK
ncbi:MAG: MFS transporter [Lachnospiraceae bacterium]|nr:MFS transporter [Lachnospiraceae bacterium]